MLSPPDSAMSLPTPGAVSRPGAPPTITAITKAPANPQGAVRCCPQCGGSGQLRLGDQRFRTCLNCLGQGLVPAEAPSALNAVASASDAR